MTTAFILLFFIQCSCVSGQILGYNFSPLSDLALKVSVDEVNRRSNSFNLYRPTRKAVQQIALVRDNTYDIQLDFGIRETGCLKYSRRAYMDSCLFKRGRFRSKKRCSSHVRVGSRFVTPLALDCFAGVEALTSSSESSSEEEIIFQRTGPASLASFSPGVILCRGEFDCSRLLQ